MNQTKPSNGPADVRLNAFAKAALDTLRELQRPLTCGDVYCATPKIPADVRTGLPRTERALRTLVDAGLVVATDRDGETVYSLAPERPARPYTDAQRAAVLSAVRDHPGTPGLICTTAYGRVPMPFTCGVSEILADLVADGDVIREVRDGSYAYRLATPPEPPLPDVDSSTLEWLRLVEANGGSVVVLDGSYDFVPRNTAKYAGLTCFEWQDATYRKYARHTLTDLGRRVLAAAEPSA